MFGNVWKHEKVCKRKPKIAPLPAPAMAFNDGEFQRKFDHYLVAELAQGTARLWKNKAQAIFNFWKVQIEQFSLDKLLEPLHHNTVFPSLKGYLDNAMVLGDKITAIKVYKCLANFTLEKFKERYWIKKNERMC